MEAKNFENWLTQYRQNQLPNWTDLPKLDLYMDQLIDCVNHYITPFTETPITKTMINSYVKLGLVDKPIKKRYTRHSLAQIIIVSVLKSAFSLDYIKNGIEIAGHDISLEDAFTEFTAKFNDELLNLRKQADAVTDFESMAIRTVLYQTVVNHLVANNLSLISADLME